MTRECANSRSNRSAATAPAHAHHLPIRMRPGELAGSRGLLGGWLLSSASEYARSTGRADPSTARPVAGTSMPMTSRTYCRIGPSRHIPMRRAHSFACCCLAAGFCHRLASTAVPIVLAYHARARPSGEAVCSQRRGYVGGGPILQVVLVIGIEVLTTGRAVEGFARPVERACSPDGDKIEPPSKLRLPASSRARACRGT